jgi:Aerotolerance regulator N-terminal/von Willebrand factor type A domain
MLTFLTPTAFFGLLLLAVPVLVHLFRPRKVRRMPFSSLRWLRSTQQRLSRRIQWHQLLLFAVRAAFIVLLVLALAHPLLGSRGSAIRPVDRYIVLDVSRSMGCQLEGQPTPLERGKEFAAAVLKATGAGNRAALLFTGAHTRLVMPPTPDPRPFLPQLQAVEAGATDTRLGSALTVLRPLLAHPREGADVEVYFVTDLPRQGWSQPEVADFVRDLPDNVHVQMVNVGVAGASNGWVSSARLVVSEGRQVLRVELGACGKEARERTVRVLGLPPGERTVNVKKLEPGQVTAVEFEVPPGSDLKGKIAQVRLEPPDALPGDDELFVNLDSAGSRSVLFIEGAGPNGERQPRLHLRDAVEAQFAEGDRKAGLVNRTHQSVTAQDVEAADVVLLAGAPDLPDGVAEALRKRVQAGAGLLVFLGDAVTPKFYNDQLYNPLDPTESLLPCPLGTRTVLGRASPLAKVRYSHRLLAAHDDPVKGDLAAATFSICYRFGARPGQGDTVLASLDDDTPFLIEHPLGAGRVLLFNTSPTDAWSNLPRLASFVPLIEQSLSYLTVGGVQHAFVAGEPITLPLPGWKPGAVVTVRTPGGAIRKPAVLGGNTPLLHLDEAAEPGVYSVEYGEGKAFDFVVNAGREDSLLTAADPVELAAWWKPVEVEVLSADKASDRLAARGQELRPWLIGLAVALLLLETFLVHYLCPRVHPTVAAATVKRRGLLRPMAPGAG